MAWNLSTQCAKYLLSSPAEVKNKTAAITISMGDGDGTGGNDTINDTGTDLVKFKVGAFVKIQSEDANDTVLAKVLISTAGTLDVAAGTFTAVAAGSIISIVEYDLGGALAEILRNCTIHLFAEVRPSAGADATEPGSVLAKITLNGGTFVAGEATNGLNMGELDGSTLKRAVDPATALTEIWKGAGLIAGSASSCRIYANDLTTGVVTDKARLDGTVATSGGDLTMEGSTQVSIGVDVIVTDVAFGATAV